MRSRKKPETIKFGEKTLSAYLDLAVPKVKATLRDISGWSGPQDHLWIEALTKIVLLRDIQNKSEETKFCQQIKKDAEIVSAALARIIAIFPHVFDDEPILQEIREMREKMLILGERAAEGIRWIIGIDGRPQDNRLHFIVETLVITYLRQRGHPPIVTFNPDTGIYVGDFLQYVAPSLREAGYTNDVQSYAHTIQRMLSGWPREPHKHKQNHKSRSR